MSAAENKAVFLSYASQDADAARRITDALRAAGVEVWFDQSELRGGDAWDAKIRKQIKECALFVPVISTATQARREGYFRLEWRIAAQRTHMMSEQIAFLLPVVIDATRDAEADVPGEFKAVQWTRIGSTDSLSAFCERVKKLLTGEVAQVSSPASSKYAGGPLVLPLKAGRRVRAAAWTIAGVVALALVAFVAWPKRDTASLAATAGAGPRPPTAEKFAGPLTEAQKLVAQARQVYEAGDELNRENLFLAEDLVKRALALDPAEPAAWEFGAWLSYFMVWQQLDNSDARRDAMQRQAARAYALAPQSVAAHVIALNSRMSGVWITSGLALQQELQEIERELLVLAKREPANWQVQRSLGMVCRFLDRPDDAIAALRRAVDLSGGDSSAVSDLANVLERRKRLDEFEALVGTGLARKPTGRLLAQDVFAKIRWRGDLGAARTAVESWPAWLSREDRGLFIAWQTYFWSRQPDKALVLVRRMPRDYLRDAWFSGPRAVLSARAHEMSGHAEAAETDWRAVVQVADRELALRPEDPAAVYWKAWALARLGETGRAQTLCTLLAQQTQDASSSFFKGTNLAPLLLTAGLAAPALADVQTQLTTFNDSNALTRAMLELEPAYDSIRADPRFQEILKSAPAPTGASAPEKSVAVLAFENVSDDKANEYFAEGISEELINVLGSIRGLKVTARTSAFSFKGRNMPVPEIGRQLGVAYVVEGTVRKAGDQLRISARLVNAADGALVWKDEYREQLKDAFTLQEKIAAAIAQNLRVTLNAVTRGAHVNPEAWRLYLEGREWWNQRSVGALERAAALFQQALRVDPNVARARVGLVDIWMNQNADTPDPARSVGGPAFRESADFKRLVGELETVLQQDPLLAEAHASLGQVRSAAWDFEDGLRGFQHATELNPNYATGYHWLGRAHLRLGRMDEALAALRQAAVLDPLSPIILDNFSMALVFASRPAEALPVIERALVLRPESRQTQAWKLWALVELGRAAEALAAARVGGVVPAAPGTDMAFVAARVLRVAADADEALAFARRQAGYRRLLALAGAGHPAEALDYLDARSFRHNAVHYLLFQPAFDPVQNDPRFVSALATLGLTEAHVRAQAWRAAHPTNR